MADKAEQASSGNQSGIIYTQMILISIIILSIISNINNNIIITVMYM